mmetsp:Transcript_17720/g.66910  ORF Transcript_17720/g.66910 Transcript_17720/m.66910 type:complete len:269 (+) Transcript_17720:15-821(+)
MHDTGRAPERRGGPLATAHTQHTGKPVARSRATGRGETPQATPLRPTTRLAPSRGAREGKTRGGGWIQSRPAAAPVCLPPMQGSRARTGRLRSTAGAARRRRAGPRLRRELHPWPTRQATVWPPRAAALSRCAECARRRARRARKRLQGSRPRRRTPTGPHGSKRRRRRRPRSARLGDRGPDRHGAGGSLAPLRGRTARPRFPPWSSTPWLPTARIWPGAQAAPRRRHAATLRRSVRIPPVGHCPHRPLPIPRLFQPRTRPPAPCAST